MDIENLRLVFCPGGLRAEKAPPPPRLPGHTLARILKVGICRTDIACARQTLPRADGLCFGHEFSAVCVESASFEPGTLLSANPFLDGGLFMGQNADGCCARFASIPDSALHALPPPACPETGALFEPVCASIGPAQIAKSLGSSRCAVIGRGRLAELAKLALEECSPCALFDPGAAARPSDQDAYDFVCDTSAGCPGSLLLAQSLCAPGGCICLKSRISGQLPLDVGLAVRKGLTLRSCLYGDWSAAAAFVGRHADRLAAFCGQSYPIRLWEQALAAAESGESQKIFIDPWA